MNSKTFLRIVGVSYAFPWISASVLLLILTSFLAILFAVRWLLVTLMIIFLLLPMAIALFYFNHGFKEITVLNTLPHNLHFIDRGVVLTQAENEEEVKSWLIPYTAMDRFHVSNDCVVVPMKERSRGFLWIPLEGFGEAEDFHNAIAIISEQLRIRFDSNRKS